MRAVFQATAVVLALTLPAIGAAMGAATGPAVAEAPLYAVTGKVAAGTAVAIHEADLKAIGKTEIITSIFALGAGQHRVSGVLMRDLVKYVGGTGENVKVTALDGYAMDVPVSDFMNYDVILATEIDGRKLAIREKGPAWIVYPVSQHPELNDTIYEARSVWQVKSIDFN